MTRQQMIDGLDALVVRLANAKEEPPPEFTPHEWAYIRGVASVPILQLRDRLAALLP